MQKRLSDFFPTEAAARSTSISAQLRKSGKNALSDSQNSPKSTTLKRSSPAAEIVRSKQCKGTFSEHTYSNSDFGACPICNKSVPLYRINAHIDGGECGKDDSPKLTKFPEGLKIISTFISTEEEQTVLRHIEKDPSWGMTFLNGQRLSLFYGCGIDLKNRLAWRGEELPIWINFVIERFKTVPELAFFTPNHLHINRYIKKAGHSIRPHMDDRQFGGEVFVIISIVSDCTMVLSREKNPDDFIRVLLPRLSLEIMAKESRYRWKHAIANEDLHGEERVSLVFRQVKIDPRDVIDEDSTDQKPLIRY